jgi:hypothetical protein
MMSGMMRPGAASRWYAGLFRMYAFEVSNIDWRTSAAVTARPSWCAGIALVATITRSRAIFIVVHHFKAIRHRSQNFILDPWPAPEVASAYSHVRFTIIDFGACDWRRAGCSPSDGFPLFDFSKVAATAASFSRRHVPAPAPASAPPLPNA